MPIIKVNDQEKHPSSRFVVNRCEDVPPQLPVQPPYWDFFFIMIIIFILWIITMSRWHAWQSCNFDSMRYLQDVHEPVVPGAELTESLPFPFPSYLLVEGTLQFVKTVVANERFIFASISLDFLSFVRFVHPWKQAFLIRGPQRCFKLASSWE